MSNFFRGIIIFAVVFTLTGCSMGSMGSLVPSAKKEYEISGSNFENSFEMALRAIAESGLSVYSSNKKLGRIDARFDKSNSDTRVVTTNFNGFIFVLNEVESDKIVFHIESNSSFSGQSYIDRFIRTYGNYVNIDVVVDKTKPLVQSSAPDRRHGHGHFISELRSGDLFVPTD